MTFTTPILFIVFNRPKPTQKVFNEIRKAKPKQLFIAADGPRPTNPLDKEKCAHVKSIVSHIDWPCTVKTLFHDKNLGCGIAPSTAITWFFKHVEAGIILEDDCLPSQSFFDFCQILLEHYKHDTRMFQISGTSYQNHIKDSHYYFTRIPKISGWATWQRAWNMYDFHMSSFPKFKKQHIIKNIFSNEATQACWQATFENMYKKLQTNKKPNAWDFQWTYTTLSNNGLSITPAKNLIQNIGFDQDATHTTTPNPFIEQYPTTEMDLSQIKHPTFITPDHIDEAWTQKNIFCIHVPSGILWETKKAIKKNIPILHKIYKKIKNP